MKRVLPFALALIIILVAWLQAPAEGGGKEWLTDMDRAMQQAAAEHKDLLLDFTGSDWCGWCIRLNEEVFTKPQFDEAQDHFVLVELDFPADESKIAPETLKQNESWQQKLGVEGFPTIYLTDAQGRPYAMTGYRDGGVGPYLEHLAELRRIREVRDRAFAAAKAAQGARRAQYLHEGLSAMHGDFVIASYRDEVEQIIALDGDNGAGLKSKYQQLLAEAEVRRATQEIAERAYELASEQKHEELTKLLDEELERAGANTMLRQKIQLMRVNLLPPVEGGAALTLLDELLESPFTDESEKLNLRIRRAYALAEADRLPEATLEFDQLAAQVEGKEMQARLFLMKGQMLDHSGSRNDALAVYENLIQLAEQGSESWAYAQQRVGDILVQLDRGQEALQVFDRALAHEELELPIKISMMSSKAAAQLATGDRKAAMATARAAKELIAAVQVGAIADYWLDEANQRIDAVLKEAESGK
jgi:thioredoxin-related protein